MSGVIVDIPVAYLSVFQFGDIFRPAPDFAFTVVRAAVIYEHGGPDVVTVTDVPRPEVGDGDALIRVLACGLNHLDIFVRRGMPGLPIPLPHISGGDIVGTVVEVRDDASRDLVGQPVLVDPAIDGKAIGEDLPGGLAEYVVAPVANLISLGDSARVAEYAALPIAYGTAHRMLHTRAAIEAGETIAILGASGGVGVACVQLAKRAALRVIACTSSAAKAQRLRELGADEVVDMTEEDFSGAVWRLTGKRGADVVVDYTGQETWPGSIRCTRKGGRLVTCGATTGYEALTDLRYVWRRELDSSGELTPVIHRLYPLEQVRAGLAELEDRRAFGKVIVTVAEPA
jgi:NADPH:quinone reductase-like Zn-dependent oxidoreductase